MLILSSKVLRLLVLGLFILNQQGWSQTTDYWPMRRGVNAGTNLTEKDIRDLANLDANLIRLSFPSRPMLALTPPYALDKSALAYADSVINWCERYGVRVVIDPHRYPGTNHPWTMLGDDPFWRDFKWHDHVLRLWSHLAQRYQSRGEVIAGYDLLNEPAVPLGAAPGSPADLSLLYQKLVDTIRRYDQRHVIIVAAPRVAVAEGRNSYIAGLSAITYPKDERLVAEVHMYAPFAFSHQGIQDSTAAVVAYPSTIDGVHWNQEKLNEVFQPVAQFTRNTGIPVFLGEFSCPRWLGAMGNRYLRDIIELCEAHRVAWTYHAYREASVWDPEKSNSSRQDDKRKTTTARLEMLTTFFGRNQDYQLSD